MIAWEWLRATLRPTRQALADRWFGDREEGWTQPKSLRERSLLLLAAALDAAQACGVTEAEAVALTEDWSNPKAAIDGALGTVGVALLATAAAAEVDIDIAEAIDLARLLSRPSPDGGGDGAAAARAH